MKSLAVCQGLALGAAFTVGAFGQVVPQGMEVTKAEGELVLPSTYTPDIPPTTIWYVDVHGTAPGTGTPEDPYTSINYAVQRPTTLSGHAVLVAPGVYEETVLIDHKCLAVISLEGPQVTIIDGGNLGSVVSVIGNDPEFDATTGCFSPILEGFTITHGIGTVRQGIRVGGGLLVEGTQLNVWKDIITENRATAGGGVGARESFLSMYDCEIRQNEASTHCGELGGRGGGLYVVNGGGLETVQCGIRENLAAVGGGLFAQETRIDLRDGRIRWNEVFGKDFTGMSARGGGVHMAAGTISLRNELLEGNRAVGYPESVPLGGALNFGREVVAFVQNVEFRDNLAEALETRDYGRGGAIAVQDFGFYGEQLSFFGNRAGFEGGGVFGPVTIVESLFHENSTLVRGGATSGAVLYDCELSANQVATAPGYINSTWGGGAFGGYLEGCVLKDNVAVGYGGQMDPASFGGGAHAAVLVRCQVYDNRADFGGGLAACDVDCTTIVANTAVAPGGGGGLYFNRGGIVMSSIVWHNSDNQIFDLHNTMPVTFSTVYGGWPGLGNQSCDPMFWDEFARDFHLQRSSCAINMGDPLAPLDPDGTRRDQGALPYDPTWLPLPDGN